MKIHIYHYVDELTDNYHSGGSAVVITDGDPLAMLNAKRSADLTPLTGIAADLVLNTDAEDEAVFIYPDAGCC